MDTLWLAIGVPAAAALAALAVVIRRPWRAAGALPKTMRAVRIKKALPYEAKSPADFSASFEVVELPVPQPRAGEVLIRMARSPINPSDIGYCRGNYSPGQKGLPPLPRQAGFEGSGTVVATGGGLLPWLVQGARVAVANSVGSTWAEYAAVPATQVLKLPADVNFEQGSSCFVNPASAVCLMEVVLESGSKTLFFNAAASALGKMVLRLCRRHGVSFVALVRRPEQREELLKLGAAEVFLSSDADWRDRARAELQRRGCVIGIDSIGGPATGEMLSCLAKRGKVIVIGFLSGQPSSGIESADLLGGKVVTGFQLGDYASERTLLWQKSMIDRVAAMIKGELQTEFTRTFPFTEVGAAMAHYQAHQSEGKVLLALD